MAGGLVGMETKDSPRGVRMEEIMMMVAIVEEEDAGDKLQFRELGCVLTYGA